MPKICFFHKTTCTGRHIFEYGSIHIVWNLNDFGSTSNESIHSSNESIHPTNGSTHSCLGRLNLKYVFQSFSTASNGYMQSSNGSIHWLNGLTLPCFNSNHSEMFFSQIGYCLQCIDSICFVLTHSAYILTLSIL